MGWENTLRFFVGKNTDNVYKVNIRELGTIKLMGSGLAKMPKYMEVEERKEGKEEEEKEYEVEEEQESTQESQAKIDFFLNSCEECSVLHNIARYGTGRLFLLARGDKQESVGSKGYPCKFLKQLWLRSQTVKDWLVVRVRDPSLWSEIVETALEGGTCERYYYIPDYGEGALIFPWKQLRAGTQKILWEKMQEWGSMSTLAEKSLEDAPVLRMQVCTTGSVPISPETSLFCVAAPKAERKEEEEEVDDAEEEEEKED